MNQKNPPLILAGFMGVGKTTLGKAVAKKMGFAFVDTDRLIEKKTGQTIAEIFAQHGERYFRVLEKKILAEALAFSNTVIAIGGGSLCTEDNFEKIVSAGPVVLLKASLPTLLKRLKKDKSRPLLKAENLAQTLEDLLAKRSRYYDRIPWQVLTENKSATCLSEEIAQRYFLESNSLRVPLGDRAYSIYFQQDQLSSLKSLWKNLELPRRLVLVTNTTLHRLYGRLLKKQFGDLETQWIILPDGEKYKNLKTIATIYQELVKFKADRKTPLVAFGGGVIGDMAGFAAATYLRGIPYLQIPTTLLAQVDSSIGGKTGVDLPEGKNLIGAFYQPQLVWIEETFLKTLSPRELRCGMAEVIKYAAIFDREFFEDLDENMEKYLADGGEGLTPVVRRCCEWKSWVVEHDEKETLGIRAKLNFGHTLGHAIESLTQYRKYTHGEAIAMGMSFAAELSVAKTGLDSAAAGRLKKLLQRAGLPTQWPNFKKREYLAALTQDKKRVSKDIHFVYLKKLGESVVLPTPLADLL